MLVAIAIPIFTTQLEKSRDAVTESNIRAAYAEASAEILTDGDKDSSTDGIQSSSYTVTIKGQQKNGGFDSADLPFTFTAVKDNLDQKPSSGNTIDVIFTWTVDANGQVNEKPTVSLKS